MKYIRPLLWALMAFALVLFVPQDVSAKTVSAALSAEKVKVGKQVSVSAKTKNVTYSSSDTTIACVSDEGIVTGKKAGKVTIHVKSEGYDTRSLALTVVKASKKPTTLPVALDEVKLENPAMTQAQDGTWTYSAQVKNEAESGTVKEITYTYSINSGAETVTLTAGPIKAGKTSDTVSCTGDPSGEAEAMQLVEIRLYTGKALYVYDAETQTGKLDWGVEDTTAPVFSGWIEKESSYNGCVLRVCYTDRKDTYDFLDHIEATDERDKTVDITVDDSAIDWSKEGVYRVYYYASDQAGNTAKTWTKVQVYKKGTAEKIADEVLSSIVKDSWSDEKKLRAIYKYVKKRCTYVHSGSHTNWRKVAVNGIRYRSGDCFTYYSVSRLLITRAGIPNIMICRYPIPNGMEHYWNLVYVQDGWYHFDTCPRTRDGYFCLQTDAQLHKYSTGYTFKFKKSLYPARATKVISRDPV